MDLSGKSKILHDIKLKFEATMEQKVNDFIRRRFSTNYNWVTRNCYFFALILQSAFGGEIYYDVINGHFITKIGADFYDWTGRVKNYEILVKWKDFDNYDKLQKERIIRDCIK